MYAYYIIAAQKLLTHGMVLLSVNGTDTTNMTVEKVISLIKELRAQEKVLKFFDPRINVNTNTNNSTQPKTMAKEDGSKERVDVVDAAPVMEAPTVNKSTPQDIVVPLNVDLSKEESKVAASSPFVMPSESTLPDFKGLDILVVDVKPGKFGAAFKSYNGYAARVVTLLDDSVLKLAGVTVGMMLVRIDDKSLVNVLHTNGNYTLCFTATSYIILIILLYFLSAKCFEKHRLGNTKVLLR